MTKEQLKLLREIKNGNEVNIHEVSPDVREIIYFLHGEKLVEYVKYQDTETLEIFQMAEITELGKAILSQISDISKQRWIDRIWGFATGVVLSSFAWWLTLL